ncbi:MAG: hypothetical protein EPN60_05210 [Nevskiaceae bacterium]|jgi:catechol-2,3-dioxygenase|nr:MAG: hypothetical protein EPO48_13310 [Nevskiaceae bacterium]TAM30426.1 MAG: hypothetical protein EPN60_05210 [Nevskiaceae bacterium]
MNNTLPSLSLSGLELHCQRFPAMIGWYRALLEAEIEYRDPVQCWLRLTDGSRLLLLDTQLANRPREAAGIPGLAFIAARFEDLAACYRTLKQRNLYPERANKNGLVTNLIYRDPDGNPVSLRYLLPATERPQGEYRPMGEEFDPALLFDAEPAPV